jgi:hypothetical protein
MHACEHLFVHTYAPIKLFVFELAERNKHKLICRSPTLEFHMKFSQTPSFKREIGSAVFLARPT